MKRFPLICLFLELVLTLAACTQQIPIQDSYAVSSQDFENTVYDATDTNHPISEDVPTSEPEVITGTSQANLPKHDESVPSESIVPSEPVETAEITENIEQIPPDEDEAITEKQMEQEKKLVLSVNGTALNVSWENNNTVDELTDYVLNKNIVVDTTLYGGFEQVGSLPQSFSRDDVPTTAEPGDIVLYSGNQLVLFFGSNSWSYTMLGHIEGFSEQELSELLGTEPAIIEIKSS